MTITVCICTRNRAAKLERALASLVAVRSPQGLEWNVLVVDNGSHDDTAAVARGFSGSLDLELASEPLAGLSHARNRALDAASGEVLLWMDDDVTVPGEWLEACLDGLREYPDAAFAGGPIVARFARASGAWVRAVRASAGSAFAWYEPETPRCEVRSTADPLPWGANMMLRPAALDGLRFDPTLGRQPGARVLSGEETELFEALLARGHRGCWLPAMRVDHHIDPDRCTDAWVEAYYHGLGFGRAASATCAAAQLEDEAARSQRRIEQLDSWVRRARRFVSSRAFRLADLRYRAELAGFVDGARTRAAAGVQQ